jgi:hypothetical protein
MTVSEKKKKVTIAHLQIDYRGSKKLFLNRV